MTSREFKDRLHRRAKRSGATVAPDLTTKLEVYYRLLETWNRKINLTSLNMSEASDEAFDRLLVEPLVAAQHVPAGLQQMMDVGSGGGSPGIPLALAVPGASLLMVESKTRKSVFLREAVRTLGLATADVVTARFEELLTRPELHEAHGLVTIRAVRVESRVLLGLQAFLQPGGKLFLFRGAVSGDLADSAPPPLSWMGTFPLVESLRSRLVVLEKRQL